MKIPKYSCSVCRKPASRKWNLYRHISNCHAGIGNCVSNWDFPVDTHRSHWNRWQKGATNQKENSHYIPSDLFKYFLPSNETNDRKPFDYLHLLLALSVIQATQSRMSFPFSPMSFMQSPMGNYNADPTANLQIFGFRGYVCEKCLTPETEHVAFPDKAEGSIQGCHSCDPAKKAAASGLVVDRVGTLRSLQDKIPMLIKQRVNSMNQNNNHLVALRLPSPHEEIIKLSNPVGPSKPKIAFPYSKQRHLNLEPAKENKNKRDYLRRVFMLGTTPLSDEELINFLELMGNATFGLVTVHNNTYEDNSSHDSLSYFVYISSALS